FVACVTRIVARLGRAGSFSQVGQFLGGVPAEFVSFGPIYREPGVLIARVRGVQRVGRGTHVLGRHGVVDVRRGQRVDRDGRGNQHAGGLASSRVQLDLVGRD